MTKILKAGLVGLGSVSQRGLLPHLSQADARQKIQLTAVVDLAEERARQTAERFGIPNHYTSIDAMLAEADVDMVLIATPIPYHFENALAAVQAGKHVYVQKTMTTTLAEADALLAARDAKGVKIAAATGYELFKTTQDMRRIVQDGVLGPVYLAYSYTHGFGHVKEPIRAGDGALNAIDPSWYYRAGGGPLPDVTVYVLHLLTSVLGPIARVTSLANRRVPERQWRGKTIPVSINDNALLAMEFDSGALGTAVGADCRGPHRIPWGGIGLYGTEGTLEVTEVEMLSGFPVKFEVQGGRWDNVVHSPKEVREFSATLADQRYLRGEHLTIEEPQAYADIMDLADAILEDRPPLASAEQARHVVELIEKAYLSVETRRTLDLESTF